MATIFILQAPERKDALELVHQIVVPLAFRTGVAIQGDKDETSTSCSLKVYSQDPDVLTLVRETLAGVGLEIISEKEE